MAFKHVPCEGIVTIAGLLMLFLCGEVMAQIYRPPAPYEMWDTWLFQNGGEYHLFFLQSEPGVTWNTLGRAVSTDLVHWKPLPPIPTKGPAGAWDFEPTLTGMTVKKDDGYALFYGSATLGQKIGVMTSPDLERWEKYARNPILEPKPPHYSGGDWRDMCSLYDAKEQRWHGYVCAQTGAAEPRIPALKDKTLVAWAYLADTEQRGGGVLTLDHGNPPGDAFDAIVFGERTPGKWMAGSEMFRRTPEDQSAWPIEDAKPTTLVQIAVAYAGNRVTLYRDGKPYATHTISEPATFGNGTAVVMGLRHLGAGANSGRFFAGAIEEARIYGAALDEAAIRSLAPNKPSDPKPVAQWTFEDGTAADSMGMFPPGELRGGARISDGKLHLNGVDSFLVTPTRGPMACIAHLTSKDLLQWDYLPPAFASPDFVDMEVPDYFELNGRHYLLFSSGRSRKDTSGRVNASGTYYAMAEHRDGPYQIPANPLLLGSGRGRFDDYVGRTIPFDNTRLLYHHTAGGGPVTWGVPKLVRQDPDGTLWLEYWPGVEKLERAVLQDDLAAVLELAMTEKQRLEDGWGVENNVLYYRPKQERPAVLWCSGSQADFAVTCTVEPTGAAGIAWRWDGAKGAGLLVDAKTDTLSIVVLTADGDRLATDLVDDLQGFGVRNGPQRLRVLARAHRVEVYVNDRWVFGTSLPDSPATGRVGLLVQSGSADFSRFRLAEVEPL